MGDLSLNDAFTQARALEQAQSHSAAYENQTVAALTDNTSLPPQQHQQQHRESYQEGHHDDLAAANGNKKSNGKKQQCWFCGNAKHPRSSCPAKDDECLNCKKKGHWSKVCRSGPSLPLGAIGGPPPDPPALA